MVDLQVEPCLNGGECKVTWNDFTCSCSRDFTGKTCETRVWCVSDPCVNGGRCLELLDGFECMLILNIQFIFDIFLKKKIVNVICNQTFFCLIRHC